MNDTQTDTISMLADLIARARKAGADAAEAQAVESISVSARLRLGVTEKVERSESADITLRVFLGKKLAAVSSSDRGPKALAELVERAVAMARTVPEDPFAGLAAPDEIARDLPELDLWDDFEPSSAHLLDLARRGEDAARAVPLVTNSEGAEAGWNATIAATVATNGISRTFRGTSSSIAVSAIAANAEGMERDDDWTHKVYHSDLLAPEEVGASAGRRAAHRLGSRKAPTAQMPVVFDPRVANGLIRHLVGAIGGPSIARGTSFLKDYLGKPVMARGINLIDDPHVKRGLRSHQCDSEGLPNRRRAIVEDGVLTTWLLDLRSSRQLGLKSTGHGAGNSSVSPANMWIEPGAVTPAELIGDIASGLYVTELIGMGVNGITGDYSRGAAGFRIENGELAWPVSEVTVAGNLKDMFRHLSVANDLVIRTGIDSPTLRIDGMTVAGQ
jgi:PmbA protein